MHKLIFLDIDGTLCMPGNEPTARTKAAIAAAQAAGHKVFVATGRTLNGVPSFLRSMNFDGYIVNAGANVYIGDRFILDNAIPLPVLEDTYRLFRQQYGSLVLQSRLENHYDPAQIDLLKTRFQPEAFTFFQRTMEMFRLKDIHDTPDIPICKMCFTMPDMRALEMILPQLEENYQVVLFDNLFPGSTLCTGEINYKEFTKGKALEAVCRYFGQTPADAIAFGDSGNDCAMLEAAGLSYAMENAQPIAKHSANHVCPACDEDGVAVTLEQLGLTVS